MTSGFFSLRLRGVFTGSFGSNGTSQSPCTLWARDQNSWKICVPTLSMFECPSQSCRAVHEDPPSADWQTLSRSPFSRASSAPYTRLTCSVACSVVWLTLRLLASPSVPASRSRT